MTTIAYVGELAAQIRGVTYSRKDVIDDPNVDGVPVLRSNAVQDGQIHFDDLVRVPAQRVRPTQLLQKGDVLVTTSSGSSNLVGKAAGFWSDRQASFGAFMKVLRPSERVDARYFGHYFQTQNYRRIIASKSAGANINNLRGEDLDSLVLPLPPLDEQRQIAAILDKADAIRAKRAKALEEFDSIEPHLFEAMFRSRFGHANPLPTRKLGDIFTLRSGEFLPKKSQEPGAFEVFGANGVTGTHTDYLFEQPVVTIGRVGSCGAINTTSPRAWVTDNALYVAETAIPMPIEFIRAALIDAKLDRFASKSNQPLISLSRIRDVNIPVPETDLLAEFAARVKKIEQQRRLVEAALERDNELFASLQERAFSGGL